MAGTFAIPQLSLRRDTLPDVDVPLFNWSDFSTEKHLGTGAFGAVYSGRYKRRDDVFEHAVVKQLHMQTKESKRLFLKEARLLYRLPDHKNIASFIAFCAEPFAIMMEHVYFDFTVFGIEKTVTSLSEFLQFVDEKLDFSTLKHFPLEIARDIAEGLFFLHSNGIVHRDLKPSNILVTNQHYLGQLPESEQSSRFSESPIKCKLADFGESRATYLQTRTLVETRTARVDRGTPAFMAPEAHLEATQPMNQEDLKRADIWSFAMIVYCLMNPDVNHPYEHSLSPDGKKESIESLKVCLEAKRLPQHGPEYEFLQLSEWWRLENAFKECAKFEPELRPSAHDLTAMLSKDKSLFTSVEHVLPLEVSQASSLCEQDKIAAERLNSLDAISSEYENDATAVDSDGTNSCAFLGLEIANQFLASQKPLEWSELKTTAEDVISNYPVVINQLRNKEELYEPIAAYSLMRNNNLINNCTLSEEFVDEETQRVFSFAGRDHFVRVLVRFAQMSPYGVGLYTCEPYTFLVGFHRQSFFVVETHPIRCSLGGDGNGILLYTEDTNATSCTRLVRWIHRRLLESGLGCDSRQSLAWITVSKYI